MADLGDTLRFSSDLSDGGGVLVNATTVLLTITLPDGTTTPATVTNPPAVTGKYLYDYTVSPAGQSGRYLGQWLFTMAGGATTSYVETFDVGSAVVTVDEALAHLRANGIITSDDDLEQLQFLAFVATDAIERDLGRAIARRTVVETHNGGGGAIPLKRSPIISVTSVTEGGVALAGSYGYVLDPDSRILYRGSSLVPQSFTWGRQNIVVTYVVGYTSVPATVRKVALNMIQAAWQGSQQAPHPALTEFSEADVFVAQSSMSEIERGAYNSLRVVGP